MGEYLVEIQGLDKHYGRKKVLSDVFLEIEPGKIYGILGENGCGKTTLFKILSGIIKDFEGTVKVLGVKIDQYVNKNVAFLPDANLFPLKGSGNSVMAFYEEFYADFNKERSLELFKRFKIDPNEKFLAFSKGMLEKAALAIVLGRSVPITILDEPLGGVDLMGRKEIINVILEQMTEENTFIISTHLMEDLENVFDDVFIMRDGRIVKKGNLDSLKEDASKSLRQLFMEV